MSVKLITAMIGLPPATISVPLRIPKNREAMTSLVMNAKVIVNTGGINPQMPKLAIVTSRL